IAKRMPPRKGPSVYDVLSDTSCSDAATFSCSFATTRGKHATAATLKKTKQVPSSSATRHSWKSVRVPVNAAVGMLARQTARTLSQRRVRVLGVQGGEGGGGGRIKNRSGMLRSPPATPAQTGDRVKARTKSGRANCDSCEPMEEMAWPDDRSK